MLLQAWQTISNGFYPKNLSDAHSTIDAALNWYTSFPKTNRTISAGSFALCFNPIWKIAKKF